MWGIVFALVVIVVVGISCGVCPDKPAARDQQPEVVPCERKPPTEIAKTPTDGRFNLSVEGLVIRNRYLPNVNYTVILQAVPDSTYFTTFLIMADGDYVFEQENPRIHCTREPGTLTSRDAATQPHPSCPTTLMHTNNSPKRKVEVTWTAPSKNQGTVTIHAMVVESPDVWYMDGPPLTVKVYEDKRKLEDIKPQLISECNACEEGKYELTFEGLWSPNTHPIKFPVEGNRRYSDLVGASHSEGYELWEYNKRASPGLKLMAEAGNTTIMEAEIQSNIGEGGVRTVIKASGRANTHMSEPTSAIFRVDKKHHLISIATSIVPSPDWFLGVSKFELCLENETWVTDRLLNLYLNDAGTDNGVSYESSNEETLPPMPVTAIREVSDSSNSPFYSTKPGTLHPYARMRVRLLRLYRETCPSTIMHPFYNTNSGTDVDTGDHNGIGSQNPVTEENTTERPEYSTPQEPSNIDCPVSAWHEWSECTPACGDDPAQYPQHRNRYHERYHLVEGDVEYRYHPESHSVLTPPSEECEKLYEGNLFESEECPPCPYISYLI